jgi:3'(2'), 5'-bisphosphate nucleotidase
MYFAAEDSGAWAQMSSDAKPAPLHVSKVADLPQMVLAASRSHAGEKIKQMIEKAGFREVASRGSSLKGCMVASGQADVYCRFGPTNEWDICAMHAVLAEAGGTLTHVSGGEMLYNQAATLNQGFIASNGVAHDALLNLSATV